MITIFFITNLLFSQYANSINDLIEINCEDAYLNYSLFLEELKNNSSFENCATKEAIVRNNFIPIHESIFKYFYNDKVNVEAKTLCQVFSKEALPSSLHYAFLVDKAYKIKGIDDFKYFKLLDHYGNFFDSSIDDTKLYLSILSHHDQNGITCSSNDFITLYNTYKKDDESLATDSNFEIISNEKVNTLIISQINDNKEKTKEPIVNAFTIDLDYLEDNPNISLYVDGFEFMDTELRSLVNTYLKEDLNNVLNCFNGYDEKYLIDFRINQNEIESSNLCLKDILNKHLFDLIKDKYEVRVVSLIKV